MEAMRDKRLAREYRLLVCQRKYSAIEVLRKLKMAELPFTQPMPESADFCEFPPVVEILEQPSDADVTEESFDIIKEDLQVCIEKWRSKVEDKLIEDIQRAKRAGTKGICEPIILPYDEAKKRLKLATTVFICHNCAVDPSDLHDDDAFSIDSTQICRPLFFPQVVGHRCLTLSSCMEDLDYATSSPDPSLLLVYRDRWRSRWFSVLDLDVRLGKLVENIVEACRLDARKVTASEMDQRDDRLACMSCAGSLDAMRGYCLAHVFGWREAVRILNP
jgi:hypothetical protein